MTAQEFITQTKELIPDKEKMVASGNLEAIINESLTNFLTLKDSITDEVNPVLWITRNCLIKNFRMGFIYFIEDFTVGSFTIFGQSEADYIGINLETNEIYLIGYEMIDEYLYGNGEMPDFENIYLIAKDSYTFLDALEEKLKEMKHISESKINNIEEAWALGAPFKEEANRLAGGNGYEFWRIFR